MDNAIYRELLSNDKERELRMKEAIRKFYGEPTLKSIEKGIEDYKNYIEKNREVKANGN